MDKWNLRMAVKDLIPEASRLAPKKPFSVPIMDLFGKDFYDMVSQFVFSRDAPINKIINLDFANKIFDKFEMNKKMYDRQMWSILCFGIWYEIFINKEKTINIF